MESTIGGYNESHQHQNQMPVGISMAAQIHHSMQMHHHASANIPASLPIPIENAPMAPPNYMQHSHSPSKNNLPSILEIKVFLFNFYNLNCHFRSRSLLHIIHNSLNISNQLFCNNKRRKSSRKY